MTDEYQTLYQDPDTGEYYDAPEGGNRVDVGGDSRPQDTQQPEAGWLNTIETGLGKGVWGVGERVLGGAAAAVDAVRPSSSSWGQDARDWLLEQSLAAKELGNMRGEVAPTTPGSWKDRAKGITSGVVESAPAFAFGPAWGVTGGTKRYYDLKEQGASSADALLPSALDGGLEAAFYKVAIPGLDVPSSGLLGFAGKTAKLASINAAMSLPQTTSTLFGDSYALGKQHTPDEVSQAYGEGLTNAVLSAPLLAGMGEAGGRAARKASPNVDALAEGLLRDVKAQDVNAKVDALGEYKPQTGGQIITETGTYTPEGLVTSRPDFSPVEMATPKTHEDLSTLDTRDFSRSVRTPEEQAQMQAMGKDAADVVDNTYRGSKEAVVDPMETKFSGPPVILDYKGRQIEGSKLTEGEFPKPPAETLKYDPRANPPLLAKAALENPVGPRTVDRIAGESPDVVGERFAAASKLRPIDKDPADLLKGVASKHVNVADVVHDPEIKNFKEDFKKLGPYKEKPDGPIVLLRRNDGRLSIVTGRHRLESAQSSGVREILAHVLDESKGVTVSDARRIDAELNIRDEKGSLSDVARYFKHLGKDVTPEGAAARGLTQRELGRNAMKLARNAHPDVYTLHQKKALGDAEALAIINSTPVKSMQAVGIELANQGYSPKYIEESLRSGQKWLDANPEALKSAPEDMFQDPATKAMLKRFADLGVARDRLINETNTMRNLVSKVTKNPDLPGRAGLEKSMRIDLKNPGAVAQKIAELKDREVKLQHFQQFPELAKEVEAAVNAPRGKKVKSRFSSQSGAVRLPKFVEDATLRFGDKVQEVYHSVTGSPDPRLDEPLMRANRYLEGKDPSLHSVALDALPGNMGREVRSALRKGLLLPSTLAGKSPEFRAVYDGAKQFLGTKNRVALASRDHLEPYLGLETSARESLDKFLLADRIAAKTYQDKNNAALPEHSDALLQRQGLDAEQIKAYRAVRKFSDASLETVRKTLFALVDKVPINVKVEAIQEINDYVNKLKGNHYVPFTRAGREYAVVAHDKNGATSFYSRHNTLREAHQQKLELAKQGTSASTQELAKEFAPELNGLPTDLKIALGGIFPELLQAKEVSPGFRARLKHADLIPGYDTNLRVGLSDYALSLANWSAKVHAESPMQDAIAAIPLNQGALRNYASRYWQDLKKGASPTGSAITRAVNAWMLAGVPAAGLVNLTQNFTTTYAALSSRSMAGMHEAPKVLGRAMKEAAAFGIADRRGKLAEYRAKSPYHDELATALKKGIEDGSIEAQAYGELAAHRQNLSTKRSLVDMGMETFALPERFNRRTAFIAGWEVAKGKGVTGDAAVRYAEDFVRRTQFEQSDANRPELGRSPAGRVLLQYKLFTGNMLRFLRDSIEKKDYRVAGLSLGMMGMFGGLIGALPGSQAFLNLVDASFGSDTRKDLRNFLGNGTFADGMMYGLPAAGNLNISAASGLGDAVPQLDQGVPSAAIKFLGGPALDFALTRVPKAYDSYSKDAPWNAAQTLVPRSLRGPLKAAELAVTGNVSDPKGLPLLPEDMTTAGKIARGAAMTGGFTTTEYTNKYQKRSSDYRYLEAGRDNEDINLRLAKALKANNQEKIRAIQKESADSMKGDPADWKSINMDSVMYYMMPEDAQVILKAPDRLKPGLIKNRDSYPR